MIGTFFNLCRACPSSMPLDKLHSEYKSTYRWHDFSAGPEVVRKPPMPNQFASSKDHFFSKSTEDEKHSEVIKAPINEPPLPRRKKCPELAYRHHEFIVDQDADRTDSSNVTRARSGDRNGTPTRRSKSEGPPLANGRCVMENNVTARQTMEKAATDHELEPLVCDTVDGATTHEKKDIQNEYRKNFKSAFHSEKEKFGFEHEALNKVDNKVVANGSTYDPSWYKEVIELRKKAGEYRNRGWCGETSRELYKKQQDLWKEVSRRSSLSALSLASSIKQPITKEDKERENKIKSSPTKPSRRIPGSARLIDNRTATDGNLFGRFRRDNIRHHLERTTGSADVEEGALIPSPTREKLMPTLPRSKTGSPSRGSPQKTFSSSRHGSPLKGSPQKSPKKISKVGRSQSVGPTVSEGSPKKQPKPMSASITASTASSSAKAHNKKTPVSTPTAGSDHHARQMDENAVDGAPQIFHPESIEQIVKSPPEPTRVKSPEQIVIMRSPDPVFWTVPLDTGKTFTVTQNVRSEGDANIVRPHSELKVTTPSEAPTKLLPQEHPQSAPPELWEEDKPDLNRSPKTGQSDGEELSKPSQEKTQYDRPVPGSTLRCLEDPGINSPPSGIASRNIVNPATIEVVDKARDRFDRFWGGSNTDDQK